MTAERLLDAAEEDNFDEISEILNSIQESWSTKDPLRPRDQLEVLYIREYAAENGHDDVGRSAEKLLSKNDNMLKKIYNITGGIVGFAGGSDLYPAQETSGLFEEQGAETLAEIAGSTPGEITAGALSALAGGYLFGKAYRKMRGSDEVPFDVDGTQMFDSDYLEDMREELCKGKRNRYLQ